MSTQDRGPSMGRVTPKGPSVALTAETSTTPSDALDSRAAPAPPGPAGQSDLDLLVPLVYHELKLLAHRKLADRGGVGSLNTTALVHEAYLKLAGSAGPEWRDRSHFFALASKVMRQVLVDRARARATLKRGASRRPVTFNELMLAADEQAESLLDLEDALEHLSSIAPRLVQVVECRFFGGMTDAQIADVLGVTERTVRRDWDKARLLLQSVLDA
jgi:RNA polymerase sigma factor (TIGR02999 family)